MKRFAAERTKLDGEHLLIWKSFILALTALLPLINPAGSALVFLGLVEDEPATVCLRLARRIAITTFGFPIAINGS